MSPEKRGHFLNTHHTPKTMKLKRNTKIQVKEVTIANPTAAGTYETTFELDTNFQRCTGMWVKAVSTGGLTNYFIGISDNNGVIVDLSDADLMQAGTEVAPDLKFLSVEFPIMQGQGVKIRVKTEATTSAAFKLEVHARLERDTDLNA